MTTVAMKTSNSIRQRNAVNSDRSRWMKAQNLTVQSIVQGRVQVGGELLTLGGPVAQGT